MFAMVGETHHAQQIHREGPHLLSCFAINMDRRLHDILQRREVIEQIEMLEHHTDARIGTGLGNVPGGLQSAPDLTLVSDIFAIDCDLAPVQRLQMVDEALGPISTTTSPR